MGVLMTLCNLTVLIVGLSHLVHVGWYVMCTMCFFMNTLVYVTDDPGGLMVVFFIFFQG